MKNYDDEYANRIFTVFIYGVLIAFWIGVFLGAGIAYLLMLK